MVTNIPTHNKSVYVSITTTPSRLDIIENCLRSLLEQDYPVEKIIVTLPLETLRKRNQVNIKIPELFSNPEFSKVILHRPQKDYGPVMKYIGPNGIIPANRLVFVCDDDQIYKPDLVRRLVTEYEILNRKYQHLIITARGYQIFLTPTLAGFSGVMINSNYIPLFYDAVMNADQTTKSACQLVDDNWVSIIARKAGIQVVNLNLDTDQVLVVGWRPIRANGLNLTTDRKLDIINCTRVADTSNFAIIVLLVISIIITLVYMIWWGR